MKGLFHSDALPNSNPSISSRISISQGNQTPSEDSSVLVLSSRPYGHQEPSSNNDIIIFLLYLDLRLSLPLSQSSTLNWGFAGVRHTLQKEPNPRYRWEHIVDSKKGSEGAEFEAVDEGEMVISTDLITGKEVEIETGIGFNPQTGKIEKYEEVWR